MTNHFFHHYDALCRKLCYSKNISRKPTARSNWFSPKTLLNTITWEDMEAKKQLEKYLNRKISDRSYFR
ncbi:MAG: hypothetical protein ACKO2Z_05820, partial [Sphaerospermopsis kisseleviana]